MLTAQRPHKRDDGISTRADTSYWTPAERAIASAMQEVERAGGSPALTDAVTLLSKARERVADHVEALPSARENFTWVPRAPGAQDGAAPDKLYTQAELDAAVAEAVDRDRIANFMLFAKNLPEGPASLVYGTNLSARAIMRALQKAGYGK